MSIIFILVLNQIKNKYIIICLNNDIFNLNKEKLKLVWTIVSLDNIVNMISTVFNDVMVFSIIALKNI